MAERPAAVLALALAARGVAGGEDRLQSLLRDPRSVVLDGQRQAGRGALRGRTSRGRWRCARPRAWPRPRSSPDSPARASDPRPSAAPATRRPRHPRSARSRGRPAPKAGCGWPAVRRPGWRRARRAADPSAGSGLRLPGSPGETAPEKVAPAARSAPRRRDPWFRCQRVSGRRFQSSVPPERRSPRSSPPAGGWPRPPAAARAHSDVGSGQNTRLLQQIAVEAQRRYHVARIVRHLGKGLSLAAQRCKSLHDRLHPPALRPVPCRPAAPCSLLACCRCHVRLAHMPVPFLERPVNVRTVTSDSLSVASTGRRFLFPASRSSVPWSLFPVFRPGSHFCV